MKATHLAGIVVGIAAMAGAWLAGRQDGLAEHGKRLAAEESSRQFPGTASGSASHDKGPAVRGASASRAAAASRARMLLPPTDAPLAAYMPALVRAARLGDAGAMCRLSFELQRCNVKLPRLRRAVEELTDQLAEAEPTQTQGGLVGLLAKQSEARDQLEKICVGVEAPPDLPPPWRLLRDAARLGHVPSMRRFALSPPLDRTRYLDDFAPLVAFRDEAAGFLTAAAERGDAQAAFALVLIYRGDNYGLIATRIRENRSMALAYAIALRGVGDAEFRERMRKAELRMRRGLTAQQVAESDRLGRTMQLRFADARDKPFKPEPLATQNAEECGD